MSVGAGGTVIDSLWVALGVKADPSGINVIKKEVDETKASLLSVGTAVKAFIAGFAVKEIADIGSTFEQNQIQIAGFLSALSQSSDFNQGLVDAQGVIAQITKDAAILPGEAQEYIDVFKAGLPFVQAAMPGGSLADITKFTNQLTAIGKTFGLNSDVIAREFDHMLSPGKGMASLRLPLFRQLLSFMPKMANGARVTAESFNAMSAPDRLKLLQSTFEKLQPMLNASATSFDAMWGAAVSALKQMTRVATVPLFKGMKQALDAINNALYDSNGKLTVFGQGIVDAISTGTKYLTQFLSMGGHILLWLAKSNTGALTLKVTLGLLGLALAGMALEKVAGRFMKLVDSVSTLKKALSSLKTLLTGALFVAIALIAEDLYQFYTGGESVTGLLVDKFAPALDLVKLALIGLSTAWLALNTNPFIAAIYGGFLLGGVLADLIYKLGILGALEPKALRDFKSPEKFDRSGASSATEDTDTSFLLKRAPKKVTTGSGAVASVHGTGMHYAGGWDPSSSPAAGGSPSATTVVNGGDQKVDIHIRTADPKAAGKEAAREIVRTAQTGVKL